MGPRKTKPELTEPRTEGEHPRGPGLSSTRPELAEERATRARAIAGATARISEELGKLPSDSTRMRAMAAVSVAHGLDHDALFFLDHAHGWEDMGRCARCGRTWRGAKGNE